MSETVSVVIAACRGEHFIAGQLRSLFAQTRPPDEILLADDDPEAATAGAAEQLRPEVPPGTALILQRNRKRLGLNENFRNLMFRASGSLIFFCDQDDLWLPQKIELTIEEFRRHPDVWLVHSLSEEFTDGNAAATSTDRVQRRALAGLRPGAMFPAYFGERVVVSGHDMAIRKEFREIVPEFSGPWLYDNWLAKTAAALEKIQPLNLVLCRHRLHRANTANRVLNDNTAFMARLERILNYTGGGGDEIAGFCRTARRFRQAVSALPLPERNRAVMNHYIRYFERRLALRRSRGFRRFVPGYELWKDYFTLGNGWRSFIRDSWLRR